MTEEEFATLAQIRGRLQSAYNSKSAARRKLRNKLEILDVEIAALKLKVEAIDAELAQGVNS